MTMLEDTLQPRPFWQHIAIGIALLLLGGLLSRFDVAIISTANPEHWPGDIKRMFMLSEIFAHGFGVALVLYAVWNLSPQRRRYIPRLISCVVFPPITAHMIKLVVARNRPTTYLDENLVPVWPESADPSWIGAGMEVAWNTQYATQSFPSAHAAIVCGLAIGLSYVFPHGRKLFFVVAIIATVQRVIFFAHWPSDVAVGASLSFLISGGLVQGWGIGGLCAKLENSTADAIQA
jgi:membrane-associated phospholipid phosphatase